MGLQIEGSVSLWVIAYVLQILLAIEIRLISMYTVVSTVHNLIVNTCLSGVQALPYTTQIYVFNWEVWPQKVRQMYMGHSDFLVMDAPPGTSD